MYSCYVRVLAPPRPAGCLQQPDQADNDGLFLKYFFDGFPAAFLFRHRLVGGWVEHPDPAEGFGHSPLESGPTIGDVWEMRVELVARQEGHVQYRVLDPEGPQRQTVRLLREDAAEVLRHSFGGVTREAAFA